MACVEWKLMASLPAKRIAHVILLHVAGTADGPRLVTTPFLHEVSYKSTCEVRREYALIVSLLTDK